MIQADWLSLPALLPPAVFLLSIAMAAHSLLQPNISLKARRRWFTGYAIVTAILVIGLVYFGAIQQQQNRQFADQTHTIDQIRALMGNNPNLTGQQVLQGILSQFSKPYSVSDPQKARLATEIYILKSELPHTLTINYAPSDQPSNSLAWDLSNVFIRGGVETTTTTETPSSPSEVGIMFSVLDQSNPPEIVKKLQRVFDLVNISTKIVGADKKYIGEGGFSIFVGPRPLS
jgi:hypothetical protein